MKRNAPNSLWLRTGSCTCDGCGAWFGLWDLVFNGTNTFCVECADKRRISTVSIPKYH